MYPVDLFEHIWAVDRLQRLGISRFFHPHIVECVNYVRRCYQIITKFNWKYRNPKLEVHLCRHWSEKGICWARNSEFRDIDDTAMGFRLLRLYGHDVSAGNYNCN